MTTLPIKKKIPLAEILENFKRVCNREGLKLTHQRMEIFRQLAVSANHPTAEKIYRSLQKKIPTISLDTIYRTIRTFENYDLVVRIQTAESQARFEVEREKHHHLICRLCGRIQDFHWNFFDYIDLPQEIKGWGSISKRSVTLQGVCRHCLEASKKK